MSREQNLFNADDMDRIMRLRGQMEHLFFRNFVRTYELPKGVKQTHAITMVILYFHPGESMSQLSRGINMEKGSITTVIDKLIKLGFVQSVRSEKDRRVYNLYLTDEGTAFAEKFTKDHEIYLGKMINTLDQESRDAFF